MQIDADRMTRDCRDIYQKMADENGIEELDASSKVISESDENLDRLKLVYF